MQMYLKKIVAERDELKNRIKRHKELLGGEKPYGFDKHSEILLGNQVEAMERYLLCLNERIEYERGKR